MGINGADDLLAKELLLARNEGVLDSGNRPFFLHPAGATAAVLLVHGFTATPWEMRPLAEELSDRGFACLAVRLPGHGTTAEELAGKRWEEWLEAVVRGYDLLAARFERVHGAGLSTGCLLLLALARQRPLASLALLSPYLRLRHRLAPWANWLRHLIPYHKRSLTEETARHYYSRRPLAGVHQINRLLRTVSPHLAKIEVPVLAIHGEGDKVVDIDSGRQLIERMGSTVKVYERLGPEAPHVLTGADNPDRRTVLDLVGKFVEEADQRCRMECR